MPPSRPQGWSRVAKNSVTAQRSQAPNGLRFLGREDGLCNRRAQRTRGCQRLDHEGRRHHVSCWGSKGHRHLASWRGGLHAERSHWQGQPPERQAERRQRREGPLAAAEAAGERRPLPESAHWATRQLADRLARQLPRGPDLLLQLLRVAAEGARLQEGLCRQRGRRILGREHALKLPSAQSSLHDSKPGHLQQRHSRAKMA
mmetsp:Transcript_78381/g.208113  ORF Transcript_78381/g.208113 Transcript_78381/m.208113 type:complete len:202 (+) Transcript_78381:117-722(+)